MGTMKLMWNDESAKALGRVVRELRLERGLSQESLAHRAGITKNQLQLIEAGRSSGRKDAAGVSNPQMSTLVGMAVALEVRVTDILSSVDL